MKRTYFNLIILVVLILCLAICFFPTYTTGTVTDCDIENDNLSVTTEDGHRIKVRHYGDRNITEIKGKVDLVLIYQTYYIL